jgi:ketosteroid isomerase-like protein
MPPRRRPQPVSYEAKTRRSQQAAGDHPRQVLLLQDRGKEVSPAAHAGLLEDRLDVVVDGVRESFLRFGEFVCRARPGVAGSATLAFGQADSTLGRRLGRLPKRTQQSTLRSLGDDQRREIVEQFVDAWERADVDALAAKLAEDAAFTMAPLPTWYRGRNAITAFLRDYPLSRTTRWRVVPTRANGQPAFGDYTWDQRQPRSRPISVLTLAADQITEVTIFRTSQALTRFGVPEAIEA